MARRRMRVADIKEILVQWEAGSSISGIAAALGYSRPTVRKYVQTAERAGLEQGGRQRDELAWERLAQAVVAQVGTIRQPGAATATLAPLHDYLAARVGAVRLSVLYQRLRDEQPLAVSWATFYRYARAHWPARLQPTPRVTVPLADPPPGDEGQVDFFFVGTPRRLVPDNLAAGILKPDRYDPRVPRRSGAGATAHRQATGGTQRRRRAAPLLRRPHLRQSARDAGSGGAVVP